MTPFSVTSPDGVNIAAVEAGNAGGPEILFIHGFNQCHLSWQAQLTDPALLAGFRMVAMDLRGHGGSDKPFDKAAYAEDKRWGDDVAAVIKGAGLTRPVLVGWSYAGRIITDYLRTHGQDAVAGINFVGAVTKSEPSLLGPKRGAAAGMFSDDMTTNIEATRAFIRACFERQPTQDEFEKILAFNMAIPARIRAMIVDRVPNPGDLLATLRVPVLASHGDQDGLVLPAMAEFTVSQVPGAKLSLYRGVGHALFAEDAPRFNRELADFVRATNRP